MERVIVSLALEADVVSVTYVTLGADIRQNGLVQQHQLLIPVDDQYEEGVDNLREAALALLEDALEDFESVPAYEPPEEDGDGNDDDD